MFQGEKICNAEYYSVGYSTVLNKYVLVATETGVVWFNRYFEITEAEYNIFDKHRELVDKIARECMSMNNLSGRFLCSERKIENITVQHRRYLAELNKEFKENISK